MAGSKRGQPPALSPERTPARCQRWKDPGSGGVTGHCTIHPSPAVGESALEKEGGCPRLPAATGLHEEPDKHRLRVGEGAVDLGAEVRVDLVLRAVPAGSPRFIQRWKVDGSIPEWRAATVGKFPARIARTIFSWTTGVDRPQSGRFNRKSR